MKKIKNAIGVTTVTLIGVSSNNFPLKSGNCFGVKTDKNEKYRIVNFNYENLSELLNRNVVSWPIKILPISDRIAIIYDERIPSDWYQERFCSVCCPESLLPLPQRIQYKLKERRGERKRINGIIIENINPTSKKLKAKWSLSKEEPIVVVTGLDIEKEITEYLTKGISNETN